MRFLALIAILLCPILANAQVIGAPPSVKLATNLITHTSNVAGTGWTNSKLNFAGNTGDTTAPDGSSTASKISSNVTGAAQFPLTKQNATIVSGQTYTISCFVKAGTQAAVALGTSDSTTSAFSTLFTFSGTTLSNASSGTGSATSSGYRPYGNSWYRVWVTGVIGTVIVQQAPYIGPWNAASGSATSGNTLYVWGCQVENAPYPSTYVAN